MTKKKEIVRHTENPFMKDLDISIRTKQVKVSKLGKDNNVLVNEDTGEVQGTFVGTYKQVDDEQFLKLFTANIALTFELKAAGIKAFNVVCWLMQQRLNTAEVTNETVFIDKYTLEDFNEQHNKKLSRAVLYRGLDDLIENKILARARREGEYYTNPSFMFNGDRIVFATVIERKKKEQLKKIEGK
ncbi:hypothetical protein HWA77_21560 [Photobacterium damselae subsp. damselae]|uniref:Plasmid replication protein RepL domain-containing protein n=1 Tax=Photobacterium damselae subsp. damselae TaxID=85581 RepID=A0A850R1U5_PHODD|nr:hypothetical protein [Photobacterium damselae subsp. damselae]